MMRLLIYCVAFSLAGAPRLWAAAPEIPGGGMFSWLRVLGAFLLVIALFLGAAWMFKHWQRFAYAQGKNPKLNVLEMRSLGNRHALYVVGYEDQRLLVASSPAGIALLTHLPAGQIDNPAVEGQGGSVAFLEALRRFTNAKASH